MNFNGLIVTVFDVELGNAVFIRTPSNHHIMVDCGNRTDFSPAMHIYNTRYDGFERDGSIAWMIMSHPHDDHIADIKNVWTYLKPRVISRPKSLPAKLLSELDDTEQLKKYKEVDSHYNQPAELPDFGLKWITFQQQPGFESSNLNNYSLVTFLEYKGVKFLFPGDLEEKGWKGLLDNPKFVEWLRGTDVLMASHHGRSSGFCADIFEYFEPKLTIVSDGKKRDFHVTDKYIGKTLGHRVNGQVRKVLSTRNDGRIKLFVDTKGNLAVDITGKL